VIVRNKIPVMTILSVIKVHATSVIS